MPLVYYNEVDPYCVAWLRELIAAGLLPEGDVDDRPVQKVRAGDLTGYRQCHFFAGIGGWAHACQLAGVPAHAVLWTGSCPCQPFSNAGQRKGFADSRHLWPAWFDLIRECRPLAIFGEQVARKPAWLDAVCADLEGEGFAVGAVEVAACAVDARQIRERAWFYACPVSSELRVQQGRSSREGWRRASVPRHDGAQSWWAAQPCPGLLADGIPARVAKLRALGNAIVPQVAAEFIRASQDAEDALHA